MRAIVGSRRPLPRSTSFRSSASILRPPENVRPTCTCVPYVASRSLQLLGLRRHVVCLPCHTATKEKWNDKLSQSNSRAAPVRAWNDGDTPDGMRRYRSARPTASGAAEPRRRKRAPADDFTFTTINNNTDPTFNQLLGINDKMKISGYYGSGAPATRIGATPSRHRTRRAISRRRTIPARHRAK